MGCLVCCCLSGSPSRDMREMNRIRLEVSGDVIDGVEDGSMQHGEVREWNVSWAIERPGSVRSPAASGSIR
jgi:hypothetical protein